MLFTGWEVRTGKIFSRGLRSNQGRRPRDASETEGKYFSVRTYLNGYKKVFIFYFSIKFLKHPSFANKI